MKKEGNIFNLEIDLDDTEQVIHRACCLFRLALSSTNADGLKGEWADDEKVVFTFDFNKDEEEKE